MPTQIKSARTIKSSKNHKPLALIIIPTYNESLTIANTLDNLDSIIKPIKDFKVEVLVFDSQSTDNTVNIIKDAQKKYKFLHLREEPKKTGLGSAYIQAMQIAMHEFKADIVFEFDADGSHQPKYIPQMLAKIKDGADVVVGSRYIKGGSMPKDWAFHRKLLSWGGNIVAKCVLLTNKYKDLTSGFRATKTSFLKKVALNKLLSKDYAYKIHLFWELHELKAKIVELPIEFIDREQGESKLPRNGIIDSLRVVFTIRIRKLESYIKMGFIGVFSLLVQLGVFNLLRLEMPVTLATAISVEISIILNFILNNLITFRHKRIKKSEKKKLLLKFFIFNFASMGSLFIQMGTVKLSTFISGRHALLENIGMIVGVLIGSVVNYFIYSRVIWKDKNRDNKK